METIKMQVYFDTSFPVQMDLLRAEKKVKAQATKILRQIHDAKTKSVPAIEGKRPQTETETGRERETWVRAIRNSPIPVALYRKIVSYLLIMSNQSSITDLAVVREASGT